jgi:hypothetical protein
MARRPFARLTTALLLALLSTATLLAQDAATVLQNQTSRSLEWHLEQQPTSLPCTPEEIAFVKAPEQVFLEKSYSLLPSFPQWECESIKATVFNEARVLIIDRPSIIDDGMAYTLIQPKGSTNVRLLPLGGGLSPIRDEDGWHNRAAMNAILQTRETGQPEAIDWLALCLAYLAMLDDAPSLSDLHYSPGPTEKYFKPYTVPGLLSELPVLTKKHLLPTLTCDGAYCTVHFYYRTDPVMPLKVAGFLFHLQDGTLTLLQAEVRDYASRDGKKQH